VRGSERASSGGAQCVSLGGEKEKEGRDVGGSQCVSGVRGSDDAEGCRRGSRHGRQQPGDDGAGSHVGEAGEEREGRESGGANEWAGPKGWGPAAEREQGKHPPKWGIGR
jgi:hypothetical protein